MATTLEGLYAAGNLDGQPPTSYTSRAGKTANNPFTYPDQYNINSEYAQLEAGSNAYGMSSATDVDGNPTPPTPPSEAQFAGGRAG